MENNNQIPDLEDAFTCVIAIFKSNMRSLGSSRVRPFPIPPYLLNLVPDENPHKVKYREYIATVTGSEIRQIPTPTVHRSPGEGPRISKRKRGDSGEGTSRHQRKSRRKTTNLIDEEEENVAAVHDTPLTESQSTQPTSNIPTSQTTPNISSSQSTPIIQQTQPSPSTPIPSISTPIPPTLTPSSTHVLSPSPIASAPPSNPVSLPGHRLKSIGRKFKRAAAPTGLLKVKISKKHHKKRTESTSTAQQRVESTVESQEHVGTEDVEVPETQGRNEGGVENLREDERSGLGIGQKENVRPPLVETNESSRDNPSVEAENFPLSHAQTSPRHSDSSQQEPVSQTHGDMPHMPRSPHLEEERVEPREDQPHPSTSFDALESRSPPRDTEEQAQLRTEAGTNVEGTTVCDLRGSFGSPSLANLTPAFDEGASSQVPPETGPTEVTSLLTRRG